ncbi:MAG: YheU family protein [Steroidobacteraceae bacterium]
MTARHDPDEPGLPRPDQPDPVVVPWVDLSPDALRGVAEAFVLREGTDYGEREVAHEVKIAQVLRRLASGEARILFDPDTHTVTIAPTPGAGPGEPLR